MINNSALSLSTPSTSISLAGRPTATGGFQPPSRPEAPSATSLATPHPALSPFHPNPPTPPFATSHEVAEFPLRALPSSLQPFVTQVAAATATPIQYSATVALATLSAALGSGARHHDGERHLRPNLFFLLLAPPTSGYRTAFDLIFDPLAYAQQRLDTRWQCLTLPRLARDRQSLLSEKAAVRKNTALSELERDARFHEINAELQQLEDTAEKDRVLFFTHVTRQRLVHRLSRHPGESIALVNPDPRDATALLRGHPRTATALSESILLAGHQHTPLSLDLRRNERVYLYQPSLSALWNLDPRHTRDLFSAETIAASRLLPRFMTLQCPQDSTPLPDHLPTVDRTLKSEWESTLKSLLTLRRTEDKPRFEATPEARKILRTYENECRARTTTDLADLPAYPAQWPDQAWRLALLLHTTQHAPFLTTPAPSSASASASHSSDSPTEPSPLHCHFEPASPPVNQAERDSLTQSARRVSAEAESNDPADVTTDLPAEPTSHVSPLTSHDAASPRPHSTLTHSQNHHLPLPPITAETALAAVELTRWFATHQLTLLAEARAHLQAARNPLLTRILATLRRHGGALSLGDLNNNHGLTQHEAQLLATHHPDLLQLHTDPKPGPGRKLTTLRLLEPPPSDLSDQSDLSDLSDQSDQSDQSTVERPSPPGAPPLGAPTSQSAVRGSEHFPGPASIICRAAIPSPSPDQSDQSPSHPSPYSHSSHLPPVEPQSISSPIHLPQDGQIHPNHGLVAP